MRITLRTVVWLVLATAAASFVGLGLASLRPSEDELAVEHTAPAESLPISAKDYDFGAIRWGPEHDWAACRTWCPTCRWVRSARTYSHRSTWNRETDPGRSPVSSGTSSTDSLRWCEAVDLGGLSHAPDRGEHSMRSINVTGVPRGRSDESSARARSAAGADCGHGAACRTAAPGPRHPAHTTVVRVAISAEGGENALIRPFGCPREVSP